MQVTGSFGLPCKFVHMDVLIQFLSINHGKQVVAMGSSHLSYSHHSLLGCGGAHSIISYFFPSCHAFLTHHRAFVGVIAACVAEGPLDHCWGSCCMAGGWESQPPSSPPHNPKQGSWATGCSNKSAQGSWLQSPQQAEKTWLSKRGGME